MKKYKFKKGTVEIPLLIRGKLRKINGNMMVRTKINPDYAMIEVKAYIFDQWAIHRTCKIEDVGGVKNFKTWNVSHLHTGFLAVGLMPFKKAKMLVGELVECGMPECKTIELTNKNIHIIMPTGTRWREIYHGGDLYDY